MKKMITITIPEVDILELTQNIELSLGCLDYNYAGDDQIDATDYLMVFLDTIITAIRGKE